MGPCRASTGGKAARKLKLDPVTTAIPVVMLTANAFAEHRARATAVGAIAFLPKPILPDELAREIRRILKAAGTP